MHTVLCFYSIWSRYRKSEESWELQLCCDPPKTGAAGVRLGYQDSSHTWGAAAAASII